MAARTKVTTELDDEFRTETIVLRNWTYTFRELAGDQYEEFIKMSEGEDGSADLAAVLKLMLPASLVEVRNPNGEHKKLTAEQIVAKPLPVYNALSDVVNRMHFRREEPTKPKNEEGEENGSGNDSEAPTS